MTKIDAGKVRETLRKYILADGLDPVYDQERSHGAYFVDAKSGREYLDLFSFFATQPIGFNHPKIATPEFREKLGRVSTSRPTLSDVYTTDYAEFVDTFGRVAGRGHFKYFFFVEGGALGVENALKVAFDWKVRKNMLAGRGEIGGKIIHFQQAFHGRSGYALSMTNTFDPRKYQYFPRFDWPRISNPKLRFPLTDAVLKEAEAAEAKAIDEIKAAIKQHPNEIAALIVEPIQSEGGDNHFRREFLQALRDLADENEFLLIFDEVQTGMGITGEMWCFEHFNVASDLVVFGKKAQIGGCASTGRVDDVQDNVFHLSSRINSTWGGNLTDMVRCQRYLEIIESEKLIQNAKTVGAYCLEKFQAWAEGREKISNVRGRGLMVAFDLPDAMTREKMLREIQKAGALILPCGEKSIRLRPHLDFTRENVNHAVEIIGNVYDAL